MARLSSAVAAVTLMLLTACTGAPVRSAKVATTASAEQPSTSSAVPASVLASPAERRPVAHAGTAPSSGADDVDRQFAPLESAAAGVASANGALFVATNDPPAVRRTRWRSTTRRHSLSGARSIWKQSLRTRRRPAVSCGSRLLTRFT